MINNKRIRTLCQERQIRNTRYLIPLYERHSPEAGLDSMVSGFVVYFDNIPQRPYCFENVFFNVQFRT